MNLLLLVKAHIGTLLFGCQHVKTEPVGMFFTEVDGEYVPAFIVECAVCAQTIISTT